MPSRSAQRYMDHPLLGMNKLLMVLSLALWGACKAAEIQSTGYGETIEKSIEAAKNNAISSFNGEILVSKKELKNDQLNEEIYNYQTGVVESYKIVNSSCSKVCRSDLIVTVIGKSDLKLQVVESTDIPKFYPKDESILKYLQDKKNIYVIKTNKVSYVEEANRIKVITTNSIELNSLWLETLKSYVAKNPSKDVLTIIDGTKYEADLTPMLNPFAGFIAGVKVGLCLKKGSECTEKQTSFINVKSLEYDPYYETGFYVFKRYRPAFILNTKPVQFNFSTYATKEELTSYKSLKVFVK